MGCCGNTGNSIASKTEFFIDLFTLEPANRKGNKFTTKLLESQKLDKISEKPLKEYIIESRILNNKELGQNFQFNINNALFFCYLTESAIVKNYLQIKELEPFNFESLYKIAILVTKNYDKLNLPKINLINKTKFLSDLSNLSLDFSNLSSDTQKIFDPNLSNDELELTKPDLNDNLSENKEEAHKNDKDEKIEERDSEYEDSEDNNNSSIYDEGEDDEEKEKEKKKMDKNNKNYIYIKGEITTDLVREIYNKLSQYMNEEDEEDDKNNLIKNKDITIIRKAKSMSLAGLDRSKFFKQKSGAPKLGDNSKKGLNEKENYKDSINFDENEEKNKVINSVFMEKIINLNLEIFAELIEVLCLYPNLKRISFCDTHFDKEFEGWENIVHLINENNNIRWLDFHKSNISNWILNLICQVIENKRIRYLDLSENFINQEGAKVLGNFLSKNKTLQRLILNNNDLDNFKKIGVSSICEPLMTHPNIQLLDFSSMNITGCGESVANLLKISKSLKSVYLRKCLLNLKDFQFICRALSLENISKTIKNVDFSHNEYASDKSLEEIGNMIKKNKTLTHLNMEKMNLNMKNYNYIFNGLNENGTMSHFSFCFNPQIKPKTVLEYFLHRKKLSSLAYIPYKANINEKNEKVEFNLEERKIIEKFKKKRKRVKLITQ